MSYYNAMRLEDIATQAESSKPVEIVGVPVAVREMRVYFKSLFGPAWTAVIEGDGGRILARRARFGSNFFHTEHDLTMLIYASERSIPVTFRGTLGKVSRGGLIGDSNLPMLYIDDYRFEDFKTYGFNK